MEKVKHFQVDSLPSSPEPNSYYNLRLGYNRFRQYITDDDRNYVRQSDFFVDETLELTVDRDFLESDNLLTLVNNTGNDIQLTLQSGLPKNWMTFGENIGGGSITILAKSDVDLMGDSDGFLAGNSYLIREIPGVFYIRHAGNNKFIIIGNLE